MGRLINPRQHPPSHPAAVGVIGRTERRAQHLPAAGLSFFPKSGHVLNLEEPALFNEMVERFIALVEAVKGALALLAASGLELIGPAPLQRWVHELIARFQLDPHHGTIAWLISAINPGGIHLAALINHAMVPW